MTRFDLAGFLDKTGFSLPRLATYLQVTQDYLEAARAGTARLTARDQAACRVLWRRLFRGKQLELPFAEPTETFTRSHARSLALARAAASGGPAKAPRSSRFRTARAAKRRGPVRSEPTRLPASRRDGTPQAVPLL